MDVLVMLEEGSGDSPVLAHVDSVPSPLPSERPAREVVTLYGDPSPESLALALAAAVESHRVTGENAAVRRVGVWRERGAVGDAAWRDAATGEMVTRDLAIPADTLHETARELLGESGALIRRLVAGLAMPDWPEGARRAISFSMTPVSEVMHAVRSRGEALLDMLREADGLAYDCEGD